MILTTRGRFAVMAMVDIATNGQASPVPLKDIAARQDIDHGYLEQLLLRLRKHGLISSTRGATGGYHLTRSSEQINLLEVMQAMNENMKLTRCSKEDHTGCSGNKAKCKTHKLWNELESRFSDMLAQISIADVCADELTIKRRVA